MKQSQSYLSTIMSGRFTISEQRILLKIVERAQLLIKTQGPIKAHMDKPYSLDGFNYVFRLPVSEVLGGRSHNYAPIRQALRNLKGINIEYYDRTKKLWCASNLIYNIQMDEERGIIVFSCSNWLVRYILDFSHGGFRTYDLNIALSLRNPFASRLYVMFASVTKPVQFQYAALRKILGVGDKYTRPSDFIRRVLRPAAKEIESKGGNGFSFALLHENPHRSRSAVKSIVFTPCKREGREQNVSDQLRTLEQSVPDTLLVYLRTSLHFTIAELTKKQSVLSQFVLLDNWPDKFTAIVERARRGRKGKGYIMKAIMNEVAAMQ